MPASWGLGSSGRSRRLFGRTGLTLPPVGRGLNDNGRERRAVCDKGRSVDCATPCFSASHPDSVSPVGRSPRTRDPPYPQSPAFPLLHEAFIAWASVVAERRLAWAPGRRSQPSGQPLAAAADSSDSFAKSRFRPGRRRCASQCRSTTTSTSARRRRGQGGPSGGPLALGMETAGALALPAVLQYPAGARGRTALPAVRLHGGDVRTIRPDIHERFQRVVVRAIAKAEEADAEHLASLRRGRAPEQRRGRRRVGEIAFGRSGRT